MKVMLTVFHTMYYIQLLMDQIVEQKDIIIIIESQLFIPSLSYDDDDLNNLGCFALIIKLIIYIIKN